MRMVPEHGFAHWVRNVQVDIGLVGIPIADKLQVDTLVFGHQFQRLTIRTEFVNYPNLQIVGIAAQQHISLKFAFDNGNKAVI